MDRFAPTLALMNDAHEIRVDGERAWCETCDWSDVTHGCFGALSWAYLHFSGPDPQAATAGGVAPSGASASSARGRTGCGPPGRPGGDQGARTWPSAATWAWDIGGVRDEGLGAGLRRARAPRAPPGAARVHTEHRVCRRPLHLLGSRPRDTTSTDVIHPRSARRYAAQGSVTSPGRTVEPGTGPADRTETTGEHGGGVRRRSRRPRSRQRRHAARLPAPRLHDLLARGPRVEHGLVAAEPHGALRRLRDHRAARSGSASRRRRSSFPGFFGSPLGGHLADTRERRRLLITLLTVMAVLAVGLWWTWESGSRSLAVILLLVSASGLVWGTTLPSWQAFVNDLVPREDLISAVSLNSLQFNAARSLGPAVAGLVIATSGPGVAFALNAASFAFVVGALAARARAVAGGRRHRPAPRGRVRRGRALRAAPAGHRRRGRRVGLGGLLATPAFGFTVVFAGSVYDVGPLALGVLNTALGVGAILAVPVVVRAKSHRGLAGSMRGGLLLQGGAIVAFGLAPGFVTGALALVAVGMGFLLTISSGNTAVQLIVAQRLRGRVMAVRLMVYMVMTTVGALAQGWLSDRIGPRPTMVVAGVLVLLVAGWFVTSRGSRQLARVDDPEDVSV